MYKKNSILVSYPFKHAYTSKCPNTYAYHYFNCHILGCTIVCYYYFQWKDWPWLWWMGTLTLNFLIKLSFLMYYGATSCWYRCYAFEQEQSVSFCFVQERSCSCWKYATKKVVFITFYMLVLSHGYNLAIEVSVASEYMVGKLLVLLKCSLSSVPLSYAIVFIFLGVGMLFLYMVIKRNKHVQRHYHYSRREAVLWWYAIYEIIKYYEYVRKMLQ